MTTPRRFFRHGERGALARSRDAPEEFANFYESIAPSVLRFFAGRVHDPHRAFDLMAETFAKAFEKRGDFRGTSDEQAAAWLWSIARSELARFWRLNRVETAALDRLGLERPEPTDAEYREIERLTAAEAARSHMEEALGLLPEDQREVIRLRFVERMEYSQIAAQLGVSNQVVRARVSRGLRTLRASGQVNDAVQALEA